MITRTFIESKPTGTYEILPVRRGWPFRVYPSAYTGIEGPTSCRGGTRQVFTMQIFGEGRKTTPDAAARGYRTIF